MMRKRLQKTVIGFLIAGMIFAFAPGVPAVQADEISDIQEEREQTRSEKEAAEAKLKQLNLEKDDIISYIRELDNQIEEYNGKLLDLNEQRSDLQAQVAVKENELQMAYIAEQYQYDSMKERIQYAYENGDVTYIDALTSIKDYSRAINQSEYIDQVSSYDQVQLNTLLEIEKSIAEYEESLQSAISDVEDLKLRAQDERDALQVMEDDKKVVLEEYDVNINMTEEEISELEAQMERQDGQIASLEAAAEAARQQAAQELAAQQEAARRAAEAARQQAAQEQQSSGDETASPTDAAQSSDYTSYTDTVALPTYTGGGLVWPMPSSTYITSGFGARSLGYHRGIDISCPVGSSVVAAADGIVVACYPVGTDGWESVGNAVFIDHGNGLMTMYYHLSGFAVGVGQYVYAGQVIAYSGNTGFSTGPHLHFGVRINGSYTDPLGYY